MLGASIKTIFVLGRVAIVRLLTSPAVTAFTIVRTVVFMSPECWLALALMTRWVSGRIAIGVLRCLPLLARSLGSLLSPSTVQFRDTLGKVDPDSSIINQHILHFDICLSKVSHTHHGTYLLGRRTLFKLNKCVLQAITCLLYRRKHTGCLDPCLTFLSLMTSQLQMVPNREKMSSKSSLRVMGFSLHTNSTFSGGLISACGRSPTISSVNAAAAASFRRRSSSLLSSSHTPDTLSPLGLASPACSASFLHSSLVSRVFACLSSASCSSAAVMLNAGALAQGSPVWSLLSVLGPALSASQQRTHCISSTRPTR